MEPSETIETLKKIPVGGRLLYRSRVDWRAAVVCRVTEDFVVLSVASPTGRNYRLRRDADAEIRLDGKIACLLCETEDGWRENLTCYDTRW
ncbi:MAG: hypothetical protein ABI539_05665 [Acidobacteriota bacterium]